MSRAHNGGQAMTTPRWKQAHDNAMNLPDYREAVHVHLHNAIKAADRANWGDDGFAYEPLIDIVRAARQLLNMESGRLDCGTLDAYYCRVLQRCGVDE